MKCSRCETPFSHRNGYLHPNCRCSEIDDNDIVDTAVSVEMIVDIAEEVVDFFDDEN